MDLEASVPLSALVVVVGGGVKSAIANAKGTGT